MIKKRHGVDIDIDTIPINDDAVYELMKTDDGSDVFGLQFAEFIIYRHCLHLSEFRHLVAMHAIFHRGRMYDKYCRYIKNRHNPENIEYHSNVEEKVLSETYGVLLYVEQLVEIIHNYSGIPVDISAKIAIYIRKCMKPELSVWKSVFIVGTQKNGYTEYWAEYIWDWLNKEGIQTYHRSTAENEAIATYICFWLKTYYPNEYKDALIPTINTTK